MLVYDLARQLAKEIGESEEYRLLLKAKERINQNEAARVMLEDFQKQQLELQQTIIKGEAVPEDKARQLEELNKILAANPSITEYRVAELRLVRLMGDVEKILWDSVQDALMVKPEV
ncbi:MAG: YlbF family regulator [Firmicutes bacterium]|nr:YlbF family regulator [Bacillota bacterium]